MPIEQVIIDNNFLYRTVVSSVKAAGYEGAQDVAHSLSLLWKYLVVLTDQCLFEQKSRFDSLHAKFEQSVEEKVAIEIKRFETERMTLEQKIVGYKEQIEALEKQLDGKNQSIKKMHDTICQ